jgi:exodeoxyribonuclease VII large subunit
MSDERPLSVSELTLRIKTVLEGGLPPIWVQGEISQLTRHRSGHWYFTLSDNQSQLSCVLWKGRSQDLTFLPEVGQMVLVQGKVSVYERGGRYQLDCFELRPAGVGELALAFEALKRKLDSEGLFALERKIPLPSLPERVGLVTSPDGAALQDILKVASKRAPWIELRLAAAAVQGVNAAEEICAGIKALDEGGWPQIIIVGRGGGSPEDLWAFNEEKVVRAIASCRTPIVSAVGHEVDVTLSDLTADLRAPTPSAAAELCFPDGRVLSERLADYGDRMRREMQTRFDDARRYFQEYLTVVFRERFMAVWRQESQRFDLLDRRLQIGAAQFVERRRARFDQIAVLHASLDPLGILARGYSVVRRSGETTSVTRSQDLSPEDAIEITFYQGGAEAIVKRCKNS